MKISDKTLYSDIKGVERYFTLRDKETLSEASQLRYKRYYDLTIEEFFEVLDKNYRILELTDESEITLYQWVWLNGFAQFVDELTKTLKRLEVAPTAKELQYMRGTLPMSFSESLVVFAQSFFGLKSYKEAEQITIGDIVIAKKADYNKSIFQRNQIKNLK